MTNIKKNKDVLKKVIASTITWVMLSSIAMQGVNAMSFNIEGLDMKVSQPTTVVQWGWSWSWSWWWATAKDISIAVTQAITKAQEESNKQKEFRDELKMVVQKLDYAKWEFYKIWDFDWDWNNDLLYFKEDWWNV